MDYVIGKFRKWCGGIIQEFLKYEDCPFCIRSSNVAYFNTGNDTDFPYLNLEYCTCGKVNELAHKNRLLTSSPDINPLNLTTFRARINEVLSIILENIIILSLIYNVKSSQIPCHRKYLETLIENFYNNTFSSSLIHYLFNSTLSNFQYKLIEQLTTLIKINGCERRTIVGHDKNTTINGTNLLLNNQHPLIYSNNNNLEKLSELKNKNLHNCRCYDINVVRLERLILSLLEKNLKSCPSTVNNEETSPTARISSLSARISSDCFKTHNDHASSNVCNTKDALIKVLENPLTHDDSFSSYHKHSSVKNVRLLFPKISMTSLPNRTYSDSCNAICASSHKRNILKNKFIKLPTFLSNKHIKLPVLFSIKHIKLPVLFSIKRIKLPASSSPNHKRVKLPAFLLQTSRRLKLLCTIFESKISKVNRSTYLRFQSKINFKKTLLGKFSSPINTNVPKYRFSLNKKSYSQENSFLSSTSPFKRNISSLMLKKSFTHTYCPPVTRIPENDKIPPSLHLLRLSFVNDFEMPLPNTANGNHPNIMSTCGERFIDVIKREAGYQLNNIDFSEFLDKTRPSEHSDVCGINSEDGTNDDEIIVVDGNNYEQLTLCNYVPASCNKRIEIVSMHHTANNNAYLYESNVYKKLSSIGFFDKCRDCERQNNKGVMHKLREAFLKSPIKNRPIKFARNFSFSTSNSSSSQVSQASYKTTNIFTSRKNLCEKCANNNLSKLKKSSSTLSSLKLTQRNIKRDSLTNRFIEMNKEVSKQRYELKNYNSSLQKRYSSSQLSTSKSNLNVEYPALNKKISTRKVSEDHDIQFIENTLGNLSEHKTVHTPLPTPFTQPSHLSDYGIRPVVHMFTIPQQHDLKTRAVHTAQS